MSRLAPLALLAVLLTVELFAAQAAVAEGALIYVARGANLMWSLVGLAVPEAQFDGRCLDLDAGPVGRGQVDEPLADVDPDHVEPGLVVAHPCAAGAAEQIHDTEGAPPILAPELAEEGAVSHGSLPAPPADQTPRSEALPPARSAGCIRASRRCAAGSPPRQRRRQPPL